jgi:hypothetical protein
VKPAHESFVLQQLCLLLRVIDKWQSMLIVLLLLYQKGLRYPLRSVWRLGTLRKDGVDVAITDHREIGFAHALHVDLHVLLLVLDNVLLHVGQVGCAWSVAHWLLLLILVLYLLLLLDLLSLQEVILSDSPSNWVHRVLLG